jgi:cytochrome c2
MRISTSQLRSVLSRSPVRSLLAAVVLVGGLAGCNKDSQSSSGPSGTDGPTMSANLPPSAAGDPVAGQAVFRFETFGNEGFWTDALQLQQGLVAAKVTPIDALKLGLSVDSDALDAATLAEITAEVKTDLSPANAPLLNDPATTVKLVNAIAVIGLVPKDSNGDGVIDITNGDKTGATCALCHTITDGSIYSMANGGSIGKRLDGRANHFLDFGTLIATGLNSRAYYPVLQLALKANNGATLGRAPTGLTPDSTEADVDAYLSNKAYYPVGMFDDTPDGNGDPMHTSALFRQDLAAPYGTDGSIVMLDNFSNLVYTALLDPTDLTTPGGRAFLERLGGMAAGDEIVDGYIQVLAATGVTGYPYAKTTTLDVSPGTEVAPLGLRVDNQKLIDMNAYLQSLQAPAGVVADAAAGARGRTMFRTQCTSCHNVAQGSPVPDFIVAMKTIFPGDNPVTLLAMRDPPLNPILNTVDNIFDDKMAVVNASQRGDIRGTAMPLLLDLARKPNFLHDNSVPDLDTLLNPSRGPTAPHPFYISDASQRSDMAEFLRGLDTNST